VSRKLDIGQRVWVGSVAVSARVWSVASESSPLVEVILSAAEAGEESRPGLLDRATLSRRDLEDGVRLAMIRDLEPMSPEECRRESAREIRALLLRDEGRRRDGLGDPEDESGDLGARLARAAELDDPTGERFSRLSRAGLLSLVSECGHQSFSQPATLRRTRLVAAEFWRGLGLLRETVEEETLDEVLEVFLATERAWSGSSELRDCVFVWETSPSRHVWRVRAGAAIVYSRLGRLPRRGDVVRYVPAPILCSPISGVVAERLPSGSLLLESPGARRVTVHPSWLVRESRLAPTWSTGDELEIVSPGRGECADFPEGARLVGEVLTAGAVGRDGRLLVSLWCPEEPSDRRDAVIESSWARRLEEQE
jgi:hypothetical protein